MNEEKIRAIIEAFATRQQGGYFACPRCGRMTMNAESVTRNALSRRIDVYVCDACGMQEALEDMRTASPPLSSWAITQDPDLWGREE